MWDGRLRGPVVDDIAAEVEELGLCAKGRCEGVRHGDGVRRKLEELRVEESATAVRGGFVACGGGGRRDAFI